MHVDGNQVMCHVSCVMCHVHGRVVSFSARDVILSHMRSNKSISCSWCHSSRLQTGTSTTHVPCVYTGSHPVACSARLLDVCCLCHRMFLSMPSVLPPSPSLVSLSARTCITRLTIATCVISSRHRHGNCHMSCFSVYMTCSYKVGERNDTCGTIVRGVWVCALRLMHGCMCCRTL